MTDKLTVVVEDGVLKPLEPVDLPAGRTIELQVVRVVPSSAEREQAVRELDEAFREFWAEASKYSDEWWDDFERDLQTNRLFFPERLDFEEGR